MPKYPYLEAEYGNPGPLDAVWPEEHCPEGYAGRPKIENYQEARIQYQVRTSLPETPGYAIKEPLDGERIYWWVVRIDGYVYYTADFVQTAFDYWRTNVEHHHTKEYRLTPKRWTNSIHKVLRDSDAVRRQIMAETGQAYLDWYEDFWRPECICLPPVE